MDAPGAVKRAKRCAGHVQAGRAPPRMDLSCFIHGTQPMANRNKSHPLQDRWNERCIHFRDGTVVPSVEEDLLRRKLPAVAASCDRFAARASRSGNPTPEARAHSSLEYRIEPLLVALLISDLTAFYHINTINER